ncbi:MAG: helicase [Proteobacteria bacterium]|nr:MAG: helicase [Pseudomonadota bacterium]
MPVTVIRGINRKPVASEALVEFFAKERNFEGELYIGYPILGSAEGRVPIDALLISPQKGLVVFDLVEGGDVEDYGFRQDDAANKLEAKLRSHRDLVLRRKLLVGIETVTFAPGLSDHQVAFEADYNVANRSNLSAVLEGIEWPQHDHTVYSSVLSALQNISTIRHTRAKRVVINPESRGAKLKSLEDSIATLDTMQSRAVIETVTGVQRIRGLAGSGKTIVLALKAAYLHAQHPEWRIAVTFNTRSLKGQFRRLINTFCIAQTGEEPDWEQIRVINAWGAPGGPARDGLYYEFTRLHNTPYFDYGTAKDKFGQGNEFSSACETALEAMRDPSPAYNAILVDEAQDFPPVFLRLCYEMLGDAKHLVYAYDELQNLSSESLPPPEEIFGEVNGAPRVALNTPSPTGARRDIILDVCYRNSRPVLASAHALGFGVYRPKSDSDIGLVQMFDHPQLWEDIGYRVKEGELLPAHHVVLERTPKSSPRFLEEHSTVEDLVQFMHFKTEEDQMEWLVRAIKENLDADELRHDDIIVINPDPLTTRKQSGPIRARLLDAGISSHLAGVTTDPDIFFMQEEQSITFTGIHRAKGNEAGMVYIINAQDCHAARYLAAIRNRLFTGMTRSKAWVRVLGVGTRMLRLQEEFERVRNHNFELDFTYPTEEQRQHLAIVHREVAPQAMRAINFKEKNLDSIVNDIESGDMHIEDLDPQLLSRLREVLK